MRGGSQERTAFAEHIDIRKPALAHPPLDGVFGDRPRWAKPDLLEIRRDFPWWRAPGYVVVQLAGATAACLFLWAVLGKLGGMGATEPGPGVSNVQAMLFELILTVGLFSVISGTASSAQNVGPLSAIAVAGYIVLAGLWSSPISGASMNPARSFGPDLVNGNFSHYWVYVVGPLAGVVVAAGLAFLLRGRGGDEGGTGAAQGVLIDIAEAPVAAQPIDAD
jgi:aquaporin Z